MNHSESHNCVPSSVVSSIWRLAVIIWWSFCADLQFESRILPQTPPPRQICRQRCRWGWREPEMLCQVCAGWTQGIWRSNMRKGHLVPGNFDNNGPERSPREEIIKNSVPMVTEDTWYQYLIRWMACFWMSDVYLHIFDGKSDIKLDNLLVDRFWEHFGWTFWQDNGLFAMVCFLGYLQWGQRTLTCSLCGSSWQRAENGGLSGMRSFLASEKISLSFDKSSSVVQQGHAINSSSKMWLSPPVYPARSSAAGDLQARRGQQRRHSWRRGAGDEQGRPSASLESETSPETFSPQRR